MSTKPHDHETAELAAADSKLLQELSDTLSHFAFKVKACGEDGAAEMERSRELARRSIKALANYL